MVYWNVLLISILIAKNGVFEELENFVHDCFHKICDGRGSVWY